MTVIDPQAVQPNKADRAQNSTSETRKPTPSVNPNGSLRSQLTAALGAMRDNQLYSVLQFVKAKNPRIILGQSAIGSALASCVAEVDRMFSMLERRAMNKADAEMMALQQKCLVRLMQIKEEMTMLCKEMNEHVELKTQDIRDPLLKQVLKAKSEEASVVGKTAGKKATVETV